MGIHRLAPFEFHVSRFARDRYQFDQSLFASSGNVIFANFHAARVFAQKINQKRDLARFPEQAVRAGQINALGLIDELLHQIVADYRRQTKPNVMAEALAWLQETLGSDRVESALRKFADEFPPVAVYTRDIALDDYLRGSTAGLSHREAALEEMLILWLTNVNPATSPFLELFDDADLEKETAYPRIMSGLRDFFADQPGYGPDGVNLIDLLRAPALAHPHSLTGQLEFLLTRWSDVLGKYLYRLLGSLDLIAEEEKPIFVGAPGGGFAAGKVDMPVAEFRGLEAEPEQFTPDRDWMPHLVLIAKNAYVWLDQLSKKYRRSIARLDHVPDEELDALARWGFTGLWLIGVWERSEASRRIKQLMGNTDAVASAYSLRRYEVAEDLGGWGALQNLKARAWRRGIRLASDMVPNHMGIDSDWVIEHPDWFVASDAPPFPSYAFDGPDLSGDGRVGIFLEDHYYNRSDAAVVFKRLDRWTGKAHYIYHGNDGTSLPWNDTAQLNYLKAEVREAVIQTILHVARNFPIIRFDAAMTLAKKHYQRLWFPEPGTGGAIASRAEHALTRAMLDSFMPAEFWREVVDRAAVEAPDTLLLAEAFWLMEGYFVRTLGMHRVYNSAFMNMLRDEDNAKYRQVMKNTLEFDPEVLKRYVNFMNNPDERTAAEQFGKGDKYFGLCVMMATLPGLPMFGHGQIEGFTEKYGMEFRRALWDETPDAGLMQHHGRVIFPLLHKRYLFADVRDFLLYDVVTPEGHVDENVFAYSNRAGDERVLVVYHNAYASTRGRIRLSAAYALKTGGEGDKTLAQRTLGEGLALHDDGEHYTIFRDAMSGLEYIHNSRDLCQNGLHVELGPYACRVFWNVREVRDNEWHQYVDLNAYLDGRGVPSIDAALHEIFLQPVHRAFKDLMNVSLLDRLRTKADVEDVESKLLALFREAKQVSNGDGDEVALAEDSHRKLTAALDLFATKEEPADEAVSDDERAEDLPALADDASTWGALFGWLFVHDLGRVAGEADAAQRSRSWIDEWLLGRIIAGVLQEYGLDEMAAWRAVTAIRILSAHGRWFDVEVLGEAHAYQILSGWLKDDEVHRFLGVNRYKEVLWFNQESFAQLLAWMLAVAEIALRAEETSDEAAQAESLAGCRTLIALLARAADKSEYQVEKLLEAVSAPAASKDSV